MGEDRPDLGGAALRGVRDRVLAHARGELEVVPTRDAATVAILRETVGGELQVCLLRRVATMAFAAGMYVFPGGRVDPADAREPTEWIGPEPVTWTGPLGADEPLVRALACAAIRETFEESGVLLAGRADGSPVDTAGPEWEAERQALLGREQSLAALLRRRGLAVRADLLLPWAHWITPEPEPRRYDTRFFVAALPAGQEPRHVGGESDRTEWMSPRDALDRRATGEVGLLPPTAFMLAELGEYRTVPAVLTAASRRDVKPTLPRLVVTGEQISVLVPQDEPGGGGSDEGRPG